MTEKSVTLRKNCLPQKQKKNVTFYANQSTHNTKVTKLIYVCTIPCTSLSNIPLSITTIFVTYNVFQKLISVQRFILKTRSKRLGG